MDGRAATLAALVTLGACALALGASGCGGAPTLVPDHVFYANGLLPTPGEPSLEVHYPALDRAASDTAIALQGVEFRGGGVRYARPSHWTIRGGGDSSARFLQYVSPRALSIGVYERNERKGAGWDEILKHFEEDVRAGRSEIVAGPVPFAAGNAQGRFFHLRHRVAATGAPFVNESHEILLRAHGRVVLVQIVSDGALTPLADELLPFLSSFELR